MAITPPISKQPIPSDAKKVFEGVIFDVYQWQQAMFDGSTETFEKLTRDDTIGVIPITPDKKIILTQEEQPGKPPFLSVPGGRREAGEDPLQTAHRELLEESGYVSEKVDLWYSEQPITKIDWSIYTYIARDCVKVAEPHLDPGEKIQLRYVSFDEFIEIASSEEFYSFDISIRVLRARLDAQKLQELRVLVLS